MRTAVYAVGALVGIGIPIGLLLAAAPDESAAEGSAAALNLTVLGVAVAYALLTVVVAWLSARLSDPKARRMRFPWARGRDEWQPLGWTSHWVEEILVGAALVSAVTCIVLWMTLGGFLG